MNESTFTVREIQQPDVGLIVSYWLTSDPLFLQSMGVDVNKIPAREQLTSMIAEQLTEPYDQKKAYAIIWEINGQAAGHCNVNKIIFGKEAYMHLHLWNSNTRQQGAGAALVELTLPYFFENLQLRDLFCEPYALNPAPNKTLAKTGFEFVKEYITTPGALNFEQPVYRWQLTYDKYKAISVLR
jgi:RimJ/RimL family protein N-acetyltransferase